LIIKGLKVKIEIFNNMRQTKRFNFFKFWFFIALYCNRLLKIHYFKRVRTWFVLYSRTYHMPFCLISITCAIYIHVNIELDATNRKYTHYMNYIPKLLHIEQVQLLELIVIISVITFIANNCICILYRSTDWLHRILGNLTKRNCIVRRLETDYWKLTTSNFSVLRAHHFLCFETVQETTQMRETVSALHSMSLLKHHLGFSFTIVVYILTLQITSAEKLLKLLTSGNKSYT